MKSIQWIGATVALLALAFTGFLAYMGLLGSLEVREEIQGPFTLAYEDFKGPYSQTGPVFQKVYDRLKKDGIETHRGIGIYFDDPHSVPESDLRSQCGSIIEADQMESFQKVADSYSIRTLPEQNSLTVQLPIRNSLSYMFGPMKAYPALTEEARKRSLNLKSPPYELYDMKEGVILYVLPIESSP